MEVLHTNIFAVLWAIQIDRNKDIYQEMQDSARETAETNIPWGSHSELHPPREIGAKLYGLEDTEAGSSGEGNPSGHSVEKKRSLYPDSFRKYFDSKLPLYE